MKAPLLILFIHLGLGGVQRKIVDIASYLASYRPNLKVVILLRNKEKFDLSTEIRNKNVKIINYQEWAKVKVPLFFPVFVIYQIWRLKPQSVLAFLDFVSLPAIWAKLILFWRDFKVILSEDHYASRVVTSFTFGRIRSFLMRIFYPHADLIFSCSQAGKEDLVRNYGLSSRKVKIISNWTTFKKQEFKADKEKYLYDLIYIGRMFQTKNLGFLIKGFKKLLETRKAAKLCLLGDGQEKGNLKDMVRRYKMENQVDFVEPTRDVKYFLTRSKILVLCSKMKVEGFPMIILEAMAVCTPVLTRQFAGADEFLKDGKHCLFFRTEEEFVKKADLLLNTPSERKRIAANALYYVKKYHSIDNALDYLDSLGI